MIVEVFVLVVAALVQSAVFIIYAVVANRQVGSDKTMAPRDEPIELSGKAGRLQRSFNNSNESLILFTIAVVALVLQDKTTETTHWLAHVFLLARILYIPSYVWGWVPWRSVIWMIGWLATVIMLVLSIL